MQRNEKPYSSKIWKTLFSTFIMTPLLFVTFPGWAATLADHILTPGIAKDVCVEGDFAYIASGHNSSDLSSKYDGLQVVDISDSNNLNLIGSVDITVPGFVQDVHVKGRYAYIAGGAGGLHVVDIYDPYTPELVGNHPVNNASGVFADGEYVYVAAGSEGLKIINGDPNNLFELSTYQISPDGYSGYVYAEYVFVEGDYAYVAYGDAGLQIIDISDPWNPLWVGKSVNPPCFADGIYVKGAYAYITCTGFGWGLQIVDVSMPSAPVQTIYHAASDSRDVFVVGNLAYITNHTSGLTVLDVSDPYNPTLFDSYDTPVQAYGVSVSKGVAYIADGWEGGLLAINIENAINRTASSKWDIGLLTINRRPKVNISAQKLYYDPIIMGCKMVHFNCNCEQNGLEGSFGYGTSGQDLNQCTSLTWLSWYYTYKPREACAEMWNPADDDALIYQEDVQCTVNWSCLDSCLMK